MSDLLLPLLLLRRARNKRIKKFAGQLPDALDMIVRSLRAGHPTTVAIALVAREMPDPLGTEFGIVSDEITFGLSLEQAVRKLSQRVGFEGLHLLSVSLSIQAKTGGNLTEILSNLSSVLRERQKLRLKIRALSAEGRMSAWIISLFPVVMLVPADGHRAKLLWRCVEQSAPHAGVPDLRHLGVAWVTSSCTEWSISISDGSEP